MDLKPHIATQFTNTQVSQEAWLHFLVRKWQTLPWGHCPGVFIQQHYCFELQLHGNFWSFHSLNQNLLQKSSSVSPPTLTLRQTNPNIRHCQLSCLFPFYLLPNDKIFRTHTCTHSSLSATHAAPPTHLCLFSVCFLQCRDIGTTYTVCRIVAHPLTAHDIERGVLVKLGKVHLSVKECHDVLTTVTACVNNWSVI